MPKIIIIGSASVNISIPSDTETLPAAAQVTAGGILMDTATDLGRRHAGGVCYVSEVARDTLGDIAIRHLQSHGVDTASIDRYADGGATTANLIFNPDRSDIITYHRYPTSAFDTVWPRIDPSDIVVFGGDFALDERTRPQMVEILRYARQRNAVTIYVTDFPSHLAPCITRLKPYIIENLELADITAVRHSETPCLFGSADVRTCFRDSISFYCSTLMIDTGNGIQLMNSNGCYTLEAGQGHTPAYIPLARFVIALTSAAITPQAVASLTPDEMESIAASMRDTSI